MEQARRKCLERILESDATHKIIVSGPGTGKTYTFGRLIENDPGPSLVITLINNLVDEMQTELGELAEVRTFHSLARKLLHRNPFGGITPRFHFYPKISKIISDDSRILSSSGIIASGFSSEEFGQAFRLLIVNDDRVDFFLDRANYYDTVGFDDSVFRIYLLIQQYPDLVPSYHIVMVDEYQDFNALEVAMIASIEERNRMLIVGDDDQSIYEFRQASPQFLREKTNDRRYTQFPLPYCTRCTAVIVSAVDSVIRFAQSIGILLDRLDKEFVCYLPQKQADNEAYPKIQVATCTVHRKNAPYIARYIESVISNIPHDEVERANEGNYPLALVIGPGHYLCQIYEYLNERFQNVVFQSRSKARISLVDGIRFLLDRRDSNLGWRILSGLLNPADLDSLVANSADNQTPILDLIEEDFRERILHILSIIRVAISVTCSISQEEQEELEKFFKASFAEIMNLLIPGRVDANDATPTHTEAPARDEPTILLTNYNGCKGLSAGFTFVTGLEEGTFPANNRSPTFTEICQLIVALTRTRKQCHLIHTSRFAGNRTCRSVFLDWLNDDLVEQIRVNKDYF